MTAPPPPRADLDQATAVRDLLRRANYTVSGIQGLLGTSGDFLFRPKDRPVNDRRLGTATGPLETLIRLFLIDEPVTVAVAKAAFGSAALKTLEALGLVGSSGRSVRGHVRLVPHGDIYLASDPPDIEGDHPDHVAGLHRPSITMADLTVRRRVECALDMGTGFGVQAIIASHHAEHVIATDINDRALAFAAFNAAVNGVTNIEFRTGSFFEPVAGETFGLVVTNPPYVISPENSYVFRDSGLGRDRISERLVHELPAFIDEGGFATILVSWIADGPDSAARPESWVEGSGCDAWILRTGTDDALTSAGMWNRDRIDDAPAYAAAIDRWMAYFAAEGIDAIGYAAMVLRRRSSGRNWVRTQALPDGPRVQPQEHMLRLFTGPDLSDSLPTDAALAEQRLALARGSMITIRNRLDAEGWTESTELSLEIGIPLSAELDRFTAEFLGKLNGSRSLGEILDELARNHDMPADAVHAAGLAVARKLLELGLVLQPSVDAAQQHH